MATERITFPGPDGTELAARLDMPEGPHLATALFAHCFTCGKDIPAARRIAGRLAAMGTGLRLRSAANSLIARIRSGCSMYCTRRCAIACAMRIACPGVHDSLGSQRIST